MTERDAALSCVIVATVSLEVPVGVGPVDGDSSTAFRAATSSRSAVLKGPCSSRRSSADKFSMASRIGDFSIRFIESWFRIESISGGKPSVVSTSIRPTRRWFCSAAETAARLDSSRPPTSRTSICKSPNFLAGRLFGGERPFELTDDLGLAIRNAGIELLGIDDRDTPRRWRGTGLRAIIVGFGLYGKFRAHRQRKWREIPLVIDDTGFGLL